MDVGAALREDTGRQWCPHLAILVPDRHAVIAALASFYGLGARRNGWLFHRALPGQADADRDALSAAGLDVAALEAAGRMVVVDPPPETDPGVWAGRWVPVLEDALARGFEAAWFSRFPIGPSDAQIDAALVYDRAWDAAFHGRPAVSLCVYIVDRVDDARVAALTPFHDGVVVPGADGAARVVDGRR